MVRKPAFNLIAAFTVIIITVFSCNGSQTSSEGGPNNQHKKNESMETIINKTIALNTDLSLNYLIKEAKIKTGTNRALILLHGVGSNEQDLFSLAQYLPENFSIISPRGPVTLGPGRFAWYEVDFSTGKPIFNAAQEGESRKAILKFVQEIKQKYQLDEVYLGGFSQGAIMSYSIGLTHPDEVKGIIALSGRLLTEIRPMVKPSAELQNLKVFISHGKQDGTLPVQYAREAKDYLQPLGVKITYQEFDMGHQISNEVIREMVKWLQ
jgi:phospholipase/carboxylesterase